VDTGRSRFSAHDVMTKQRLPPLFLREKQLNELFPFSRSYLCEMRKTGKFPAGDPLFPHSRARVWTWSAVQDWLRQQLGSDQAGAVLAAYRTLFFGTDEHDGHLTPPAGKTGSPQSAGWSDLALRAEDPQHEDGVAEPEQAGLITGKRPACMGSPRTTLSRSVR
jgi:predicted DNA-binding transcriptional regulator AlpA